VAEDLAARFRPVHEAGAGAFNSGDLDRALDGLPDDFEWHPLDVDPDESLIRGPAAIKDYFQKYREVFDEWHTEPLEYEQLGASAVLVHHVITGTSRGAGVPVKVEVFEVWEFDGDVPKRARQFASREEATATVEGGS
jgi:ketosteroid isomerase-like protein